MLCILRDKAVNIKETIDLNTSQLPSSFIGTEALAMDCETRTTLLRTAGCHLDVSGLFAMYKLLLCEREKLIKHQNPDFYVKQMQKNDSPVIYRCWFHYILS
jgi:hypothetical protein